MRDDVGLGEVTRCLEPAAEFVEESEVEVDLLVERAVEGPGRRARRPATRVGLTTEEDHLGALVRLAGFLKLLAPEALRITGDELDELLLLVLVGTVGDRRAAGAGLRNLRKGAARSRNIEAAAPSPALDEEEVDDDEHDDRADPSAAHAAHRDRESHPAAAQSSSLPSPILDVGTPPTGLPLHRWPLYPRPEGRNRAG